MLMSAYNRALSFCGSAAMITCEPSTCCTEAICRSFEGFSLNESDTGAACSVASSRARVYLICPAGTKTKRPLGMSQVCELNWNQNGFVSSQPHPETADDGLVSGISDWPTGWSGKNT